MWFSKLVIELSIFFNPFIDFRIGITWISLLRWKIHSVMCISSKSSNFSLNLSFFQREPDGKPSFLHLEWPHETFPISFRSPSSITVRGPPESPMQDVAPSTIAHCCRDVKFCKTQVFRHSSMVMHWKEFYSSWEFGMIMDLAS